MKIEIKISADGSTTLYNATLNEHYHSIHGAFTEAMHVFINAGLKQIKKDNITILELGFGTGLNAFLTLINQSSKTITYHSLEKHPLSTEIIQKINYSNFVENKDAKHLFQLLHKVPWDIENFINSKFALTKFKVNLLDFEKISFYDLIYFDAFAPDKQPELWTEEVFKKMHKSLKHNGLLTTYSAKGKVRRTLQAVGFKVERLPGPPGKREMIRAIKK